MIAIAAALGWPILHMNIVIAFLNGSLQESIYILQLQGFVVKGSEHMVCELHRSIYELTESSHAGYQENDSFLTS